MKDEEYIVRMQERREPVISDEVGFWASVAILACSFIVGCGVVVEHLIRGM